MLINRPALKRVGTTYAEKVYIYAKDEKEEKVYYSLIKDNEISSVCHICRYEDIISADQENKYIKKGLNLLKLKDC
jgi:hypothetical protein